MTVVPDQSAVVVKPRSRLLRGTYLVLGLLCVGVVYFSWLPGIPTFDFVILAAFFFARSSDRFHSWLVNHRVFGKIIRGYRSDGFTVGTKVWASLAVIGSLTISVVWLTDIRWVRMVLALVGIYAVWFIWSRPTKAKTVEAAILPTPPAGT